MAYTQQQIDNLKAAIAEGALQVRYSTPNGERQVTYRSLAEMQKILADMEQEVGTSSIEAASGVVYPSYSKGLHVP